MTRFEQELSGALGAFWKKDAEKELARVNADLEAGKITIDENGVARNCIGRVLMDDMLEKVQHLTDKVSAEATRAAREAETAAFLEEYRKNYQGPTEEEKIEMRAAFGEGETVVDIITGERIAF